MFSRIFPKQFDNIYRGHWLAIWLFVVVVFMKGTQGVVSIVNTHKVVTTADGIPVDSYGAAGAETVIALTALLGLCLVVITLQSVVVLIRYRAMIPFMFFVQLILQIGSKMLLALNPITRSGEQSMGYAGQPIGFWVNLAILALTVIGVVLSLRNKSDSPG